MVSGQKFILTVINTVGICQQQMPQHHFCRHRFYRALQVHSRSLSRSVPLPQSPPIQRPPHLAERVPHDSANGDRLRLLW
jgi:hypothetical protein